MTKQNIYSLDGRVPLQQAIPFGLQHVLAMFVANITPIIILANVVGIDPALSASLVQNCMVIAGIGTLIQLYPVWRIGSRLPIVMGISFTFLSLAIAIASTQGMGTLMGAVIVGCSSGGEEAVDGGELITAVEQALEEGGRSLEVVEVLRLGHLLGPVVPHTHGVIYPPVGSGLCGISSPAVFAAAAHGQAQPHQGGQHIGDYFCFHLFYLVTSYKV